MPSTPLAHLYDLALRTLDGQQRRIAEIRSRVAPALASAALGVALLGGPAVDGVRSGSPAAAAAMVIVTAALLGSLVAGGLVLRSRPFEIDLDVLSTRRWLRERHALEDVASYQAAMLGLLGSRSRRNWEQIRMVETTFTVMMCGILVVLCGLATAAVIA